MVGVMIGCVCDFNGGFDVINMDWCWWYWMIFVKWCLCYIWYFSGFSDGYVFWNYVVYGKYLICFVCVLVIVEYENL